MSDLITNKIQSAINNNNTIDQFNVSKVPFHTHNDIDSPTVSFKNITNRFQTIFYTLSGTSASTAGNYSSFFIAPFALRVSQIQEVHTTAGTDGSAVTLYIEKLIGTTTPGSGTNLMSNTFNLKGTINSNQNAVLVSNAKILQLNAGDRLGLVKSGTLTSVANVTVSLIINF